MPDFLITLTDEQVAEAQAFDVKQPVEQILQTHVDTWLLPFVSDRIKADTVAIADAVAKADVTVRTQVKKQLGLDRVEVGVAIPKR